MKIVFLLVLIFLGSFIYGADCDIIKPEEKDGGCKIEKKSSDLITCLINAKNDKEAKICNQKEKERNCKKISEKYNNKKNLNEECNMFYDSKKIDCLINSKTFQECENK